jgi:D-aminopeptidase
MKGVSKRPRAREHEIASGIYNTGPNNAITDVSGVLVGHTTLIEGSGPLVQGVGPVRTGVTAIMPRAGNVFDERVVGGGFVLNGAGEVSGLTQVLEWGLIETPILLTNTFSVGAVADATVQFMLETYPSIGRESDVIIPLVGECDDSWLNDIRGQHVEVEHVYHAIETAEGGMVPEGAVGAGTGMVTCGFKAGIGTSSRVMPDHAGRYTVGVLVMSNFGWMEDLLVAGLPVGKLLKPRYAGRETRTRSYGSIIAVVATDAPLHTHQLNRLSKRVALGIGRCGSYAAHNSGEIVVAFSIANTIPRTSERLAYRMEILLDEHMDPLYQAALEATEEAILNSLCVAGELDGVDGRVAPAFPADIVRQIIAQTRTAARDAAT